MPQIKWVMLQYNKINKIPASLLPWISSSTISISLEGNYLTSEITELNEFRKSVKISKGMTSISFTNRLSVPLISVVGGTHQPKKMTDSGENKTTSNNTNHASNTNQPESPRSGGSVKRDLSGTSPGKLRSNR